MGIRIVRVIIGIIGIPLYFGYIPGYISGRFARIARLEAHSPKNHKVPVLIPGSANSEYE